MSAFEGFYYDQQLRRYIVQFAAIFAGMQVKVGKSETKDERLIHVPIKNASSSRVVAAIKGEHTQNKMLRLPVMSCQLLNIDMAPELRKGVANKRRNTYMPTGGLFPDDIEVVEQRMPVPYKANLELGIFTSNQDQHYQLIEQITTLFDPILQIQTSDEMFDWTKITTIELMDIRFDENVPAGTERRIIQTTLAFSMPIYLSIPNVVHDKYIKDIFIRIGAVMGDLDNSYEIIADLDNQGVEYDHIFSLSDVQIDDTDPETP